MRSAWRLFKSDLKRLGGNVVTLITVIGLVALPSIFSWYNIIACWSVFDNTGNLTVAVANTDEGYTSDLVPLEINIGDQVASELRANDQLNWVFTDEEDAIDGARSGRYYAAVVIPESFSRDMMSFYSNDVEHAKITYYSNQKKSAIAPKVTDQGADQVSAQVNEVFAETISNVVLSVSSALMNYVNDSDVDGRLGTLATRVATVSGQMGDSAAAITSYANVLATAQSLVDDAGTLLSNAQGSAAQVASESAEALQAAQSAVQALQDASQALASSLAQAEAPVDDLPASVTEAYDEADRSAAEAQTALNAAAEAAEASGDDDMATDLRAAAAAIAAANETTQATRSEALALTDESREKLQGVQTKYEEELKQTLDELSGVISQANDAVSSASATLSAAGSELTGSASSISGQLDEAKAKLNDAAAELEESSARLADLSQRTTDALSSQDLEALRAIIGQDPEALAAAIAAPVQLERIAVYPVENFGSAMSPLYTTLALWIGALLIMVTLRTHPSPRTLEEVGNPSARSVFMGRLGVASLISFMQSTVLAVGNLLFLEVQAVNPFLYLLCFWVAGLVFTFIIYTLVSVFANLGKALSVILLIVQVSGGGGSFPLQLLPEFFQNMSPYLPIAHAVNAMRAAMFGIYQGDFWIEIGTLLLFVVPMAILGLVLYKPLGKIVPRFIERVEASKLM